MRLTRTNWIGLQAVFVVAALYFVCDVSYSQEAASDESDPPGTHYASGLKLMSEPVKRGLPELPGFRAFLPESADLSPHFPRPRDQGRLGSCAAWAVGYAARSYFTSVVDKTRLNPSTIPSPSYLYHRARSGSCDEGSTLAENVGVLKQGALSLAELPYSDSCRTISPGEISRAHGFKVLDLAIVDHARIDNVRGRLAQGEPVILSLQIPPSFDDYRSGVYRPRSLSGKIEYHAVVATGYDDRRQALRIINSWGTKWGDRGYMWLSYDAYAMMALEAVVLQVAGFAPSPPEEPIDTTEIAQLVDDINKRTCANVSVRQEGKGIIVSGFVGNEEDLRRLMQFAAARADIKVDAIEVAAWPKCELTQMLARATSEPDKPGVTVANLEELHGGQQLDVTVRTPEHFSYLYVTYLQADNSVVHLVQPNGPGAQTEPGRELRFGDGKDGRPKITISSPFGREGLLIITSRSPLFDGKLPDVQTARDYLTLLRKALVYRPDPEQPERVIAASMTEFETKAPK